MSTTVKLYIPRIASNTDDDYIKQVFQQEKIGIIHSMDTHTRRSEHNKKYKFSFIELTPYSNYEFQSFYNKLMETGVHRIVYNKTENFHWVVKAHLDQSYRPDKLLERLSEDGDVEDEDVKDYNRYMNEITSELCYFNQLVHGK